MNIVIKNKEDNERDKPRHLIITGINGTGKTVLLEGMNQCLRERYSENKEFSNKFSRIEVNKDDNIKVKLIYCDKFYKCLSDPDYFEPLYIMESEMFRPARGLNMYDYTDLFFRIASNSDILRDNLSKALRALYKNEFEDFEFDVSDDCGKIKLRDRNKFSISHMSSGHYSFLNVYCHIRFTQIAFNWVNDDIWETLTGKIEKCIGLVSKINYIIDIIVPLYTGKYARPLAAMKENEPKRVEKLTEALGIANARKDPEERSRKRDRDLIMDISYANSAAKNKDYTSVVNNFEAIISDIIMKDKLAEAINEKLKENSAEALIHHFKQSFNDVSMILKECSDILFSGETNHEDFPLIVLIDEPESHLHIALQREVMPYLADRFKNVQFIVATHSPFVITSLSNATLFNMENRQRLVNDLTLYSYQNVVQGWFGLSLSSDETKKKYEDFKKLADSKFKLTKEERIRYVELYNDLVETDFIVSVTDLNMRKELKDGEIYVLC